MRLYISKCLAQDLMKEKGFVRVFYCCITNCHKLRDFKQYTFVSQFASGDMAWLPGTHGRVALGVFWLPYASSRPHLLAQLREGIAAGQVAVGTGDRLSPLAQAPPPASMCLTREDQGEFSKSQLQEKLK